MHQDDISSSPEFIRHFRLAKLQRTIIKLLILHGPLSAFRLSRLGSMHYESVWRSLKNLESKGLIRAAKTKKGVTNKLKTLYEITGLLLQALLNIDPDIAWQMGAWIYTIKEVHQNRLVEALLYLPKEDKLHRIVIPLTEECEELACRTAQSMPCE